MVGPISLAVIILVTVVVLFIELAILGGGRGCGRGHGPRFCTHCSRANHTVDRCWDFHGHPTAPQVAVVLEVDIMIILADEYQRLLTT